VDEDPFVRVQRIALGLPGVTERFSHGAPCFFVGDRPLCYFHDHHGDDARVTLWCPALAGVAEELAEVEPERYFRPQPSRAGVFGQWLGIVLDPPPGCGVEWGEVASILEDAFRMVAPRRLVADLEAR